MEICQLDQDGGGDVHISTLVVAVDPLAAKQDPAHFLLGQVLILPQVPDSAIIGQRVHLVSDFAPIICRKFFANLHLANIPLLTFSEFLAKIALHFML